MHIKDQEDGIGKPILAKLIPEGVTIVNLKDL